MSKPPIRRISFQGEGFAGFAWSTRQSATRGGRGFCRPTKAPWSAAPVRNVQLRGLYYSTDAGATWSLATITDGPGARRARTAGFLRSAERKLGHCRHLESSSPDVHRRRPLSRLLPVERWHHVDAHDRAARRRPDSADVSQQSGRRSVRLHVPSFAARSPSIRITGDTFAWTVDLNQPGPGALAGCMFPLRRNAAATRRSPLRSDGALRRLSPTQAWEQQRSPTATTISCSPPFPPQQDTLLLAGANDLWRCSLADGMHLAQHHQRDHLHERTGCALSARACLESCRTRRRFSSATTAVSGVRWMRLAKQVRLCSATMPRTSRI